MKRAAEDYAKAACGGIGRAVGLMYIASISILVVIGTVGREIHQLQEEARALAQVDKFLEHPDSSERTDWGITTAESTERSLYGDFAARKLGIDANLGTANFREYTNESLLQPDIEFLDDLWNDVPLQCLRKFIEPSTELLVELAKDQKIFSPSQYVPIDLQASGATAEILGKATEPHLVSILDVRSLETRLNWALVEILEDRDHVPRATEVVMFDKPSYATEIFSDGRNPYEVDPRFPIREGETIRLDNRTPIVTERPFQTTFCAENFKLIDTDLVVRRGRDGEHGYVQLRMRFSNSRPEIGKGNAYEDSLVFKSNESYMWPEVDARLESGRVLVWNEYGDLYTLVQAEVRTISILGPLTWAAQSSSFSIDQKTLAVIERVKSRVATGPQPKQSFTTTLQAIRAALEETRDNASAGVADFQLPLNLALPGAALVQILALLSIARLCRGLQRGIVRDVIEEEFFSLQTEITISGTRWIRVAIPIVAVGLAIAASWYATSFIDVDRIHMIVTVALYAIAFGLSIWAGKQLGGLGRVAQQAPANDVDNSEDQGG